VSRLRVQGSDKMEGTESQQGFVCVGIQYSAGFVDGGGH
jgi:hypothetical protein